MSAIIHDNKIDFVITWVDGSDPVLQKKRQFYALKQKEDATVNRYRDWGTLRYWFRGVEKFAPWVDRIWLITDNQKPKWLKQNHSKLTIVDHRDYIPPEFLPTFNSNPIELNIHRIKGLSEQFVLFNDDMFLIRPIKPEFFFCNGLPCDDAILSPIILDGGIAAGKMCANNMHIINQNFNKKEVIAANPRKWFNALYGKQMLRTLCLLPWHHLPGFYNDHLAQAFLKSTFEKVWEKDNETLREVSTHRFRSYETDVNQWLMRYWQLCEGNFTPTSPSRGRVYSDVCQEALNCIRHQKASLICVNDNDEQDFENNQRRLIMAFESILPSKSSFEV